jgi:hypothetical protein
MAITIKHTSSKVNQKALAKVKFEISAKGAKKNIE